MLSFLPSLSNVHPNGGPFPQVKTPPNVWRLHFSLSLWGSVVSEQPLGSLYFCQAGPLAFLHPFPWFSWLSPPPAGILIPAGAGLQRGTITAAPQL